MKRSVLVLLVAGLVFAPATVAKGPHAVLTTPRETVEPGKPWQFTVELNEFRHPPMPAMIGRRGDRTVGAEVERIPAAIDGAAGFRFTMVFPHEGRWKLRLFAGKRRFAFPAVRVGSYAARESATGDGGVGPWLLPLLGAALAGAGVAAVTRRGSRQARRPRTDAARPPSRG